MSESPGSRVSHYRIIGHLGQGGMGVVFRGEDELLRRPVALKFLPDVGESDRKQHARFMREARTAASINHPNVCTIYHVGEIEPGVNLRLSADGPPLVQGTPYIVMELVEGQTLADALIAGPLPLDQLLDVALQIAEGVAEAHERGIVHRDLKAANVMLTDQGRVKILDFGLARVTQAIEFDVETGEAPTVTELTRAGTILGTLSYMSPEQLQGQPVDAATDLFSLGVLLFEMATGQRPFHGETGASTMAKILEAEAPSARSRREDLPEVFEHIISRCLRKKPDERGDSAQLVRELRELRGVTGGVSLPGTTGDVAIPLPTGERGLPSQPTRILPRRRPRWIPAVAVVAVAILAVAVWYVVGTLGPPRPSSVAVLPITNLDDDAFGSQYVAEGIARSIADRLRLTDLYVTPWVTSRNYGQTDRPAAVIGEDLKVDTLLTGSFRSTEDQEVELELTLFNASAGQRLATARFVSTDGLLQPVQREALRWVANTLNVRLDAPTRLRFEANETDDPDAWDFYLQGAYALQEGGREPTRVAEEFFARAIQLDPEFVNAHVGFGAVHSDYYFFGWEGYDSLKLAEKSYETALRLDPTSLSARRGLIRVVWEEGLSESALHQGKEVERQGADDAEALITRAEAYVLGGLPDKALPLLAQAIELDPVNVGAHWFQVIALAWSGQHEATIRAGNGFIELLEGQIPDSITAEVHCWVAYSNQALGRFDLARDHYEKSVRMFGDSSNVYVELMAGWLQEQMGNKSAAVALWRRSANRVQALVDASPTNVPMRVYLASLRVLLGENDAAATEEAALMRADSDGLIMGYYLAGAYLTRGNTDRAVFWLRRIADHGGVHVYGVRLFEEYIGVGFEDHPEVVAALKRHRDEEARLRRLF